MVYLKEKWNIIKEFVEKELGKNGEHGLDHILRVVQYCKYIGKSEGANLDILIPAAYLHDIARPMEIETPLIDHAEEGAKIAEKFLESINYPYIENITYAIKVHRYRKNLTPETLEAKILQDADRIDALGAIGIYRVISHSAKTNHSLEHILKHFEEKILNLYSRLYTKTAKLIAYDKHKMIVKYVEFLKEELKFVEVNY
ncbi:HD domain-containing protein [Thermosipho ferrireducens]|uniref:HD domain-containing protein n=1 Tax=Thermosipho ferrireducens TaxID=2571116 RepID=A0ABX7SA45_9BACT|nr:HD domain-containing protein [Thermosipho ferrireducens]QTA38597.1 HD domain-containing protein [Thermosipho ferrireducens]